MPTTDAELERALADAMEVEELREAALDYIRADYLRTHAWTKTRLCVALGHPDKYPPGTEPKFYEPGCPCGKRRGPA
jgi:hypothetical protein